MLRLTKSRSSSGAANYFRNSLRSADYYLEGKDVGGEWHGVGAARLGLAGKVHDKDFIALLENRTPQGAKLTARDRANRVPMIDFTFNAPKSVSLLWALTEDERLATAHKLAVSEAMAEVEANMETRVRKGRHFNTDNVCKTGNIIWAGFHHDTARPIDGYPDPHLHTHAAVINATWDDEERQWKAVQIGNIAAEREYYEAVYLASLAHQMKRLGFAVERKGKWWDLADIPKTMLDRYSRRTKEIEDKAAELGDLSAAQKGALGVMTRDAKDEALFSSDLHAVWKSKLRFGESERINGLVRKAERQGKIGPTQTVTSAWEHGLSHALERQSVAHEKKVMSDALRFGAGDVRVGDLKAVASLSGIVRGQVNGRDVVTTKDMLAKEQEMIGLARRGKMACRALGHGNYEISKDYLNDKQRAAIEHIWNSRDRVMVVQGDAGVGKTAGVLAEAVNGLHAQGIKTASFAPASGAVSELEREVNAPAYTLARLLVDESLQRELRGAVLVVDEAGQIGVRDMCTLLHIAEDNACRLVLTGDTKQHGAVAAGDALRLLQERANLNTAQVQEIVRQKGAYKQAVDTIAKGDLKGGWKQLDALGAIKEIASEERFTQAANDYVEAVAKGQSALVVAPTHWEKDKITGGIRSGLRAKKALSDDETAVLRLKDTRWTEAQRRDASNYEAGMVVKAFQNMPHGVTRGDRMTIMGRDDNGQPLARTDASNIFALPLDKASDFKVYETEALPLSSGDLVRVTEQAKDLSGKKLVTGQLLSVKSISKNGHMSFENGIELSPSFGHLDYGYCSTSYSSQGRTVDTVIASMSERSSPAMSSEQFYVTVSRGKSNVRIYTDDKDATLEAISKSGARGSAIELQDGSLSSDLVPTGRNSRVQEQTEFGLRYRAFQEARAEQSHAIGRAGARPIDPAIAARQHAAYSSQGIENDL